MGQAHMGQAQMGRAQIGQAQKEPKEPGQYGLKNKKMGPELGCPWTQK